MVALLALAGLVRLVAAVEYPLPIESDAASYDFAANSLITNHVLLQKSDASNFGLSIPSAPVTEPLHHFGLGYPSFLSAVYMTFGPGRRGVTAALAIAALGGAFLVSLLAGGLFLMLGGRSTWYPMVLLATAFWPETILMGRELLSENLTIALFTAWILVCAALLAGNRAAAWVAPIVGSSLFLTRPDYLPMILLGLIVLSIDFVRKRSRRQIRTMALVSLAMLPALAFPGLRSLHDFGEWIPLTTAGGRALWLASMHSDSFYFSGRNKPVLRRAYVPGDPELTEKNISDVAWSNIRRNPLYYLEGCAARLVSVNLSSVGEPAVRGRGPGTYAERALLKGERVFLFIASIAGLLRLRRISAPMAAIIGGSLLYKIAIHSIMDGSPRMIVPFIPVLLAVTLAMWKPESTFTVRSAVP